MNRLSITRIERFAIVFFGEPCGRAQTHSFGPANIVVVVLGAPVLLRRLDFLVASNLI